MKHRQDIDGLRAVAVIPVVLYHMGLTAFGGGFVGVDVFFVISGFLITSMITEELRRGRFSIRTFYERRIRRIFPALFTVLLVTAVLAAFILMPADFASFSGSLVATALFGSNIFFYKKAGYFGDEAHTKPLLHTWSLSVEEQYYLFFPLLLLLIHRKASGRWTPWILGLGGVSFAASVWGVERYPEATFYLLPTRAWELFLGALLALGAVPALRAQWQRELAAVLGVVLLAVGFCTFGGIPFPGAAALVPCLGAGLVIFAGTDGTTRVSRLLSHRTLVFVGLISYSLYLWHWPLLSLGRHLTGTPLTLAQAWGLVALSLMAATLSWRYVEQPMRQRSGTKPRPARVFALAGAVSVLAIALGTAGVRSGGWPGRVSDRAVALDASRKDFNRTRSRCHGSNGNPITYATACRYGPTGAPARFAVWGDSHAAEVAVALGEMAGDRGSSVRLLSYSSCPPVLAIARRKLVRCVRHNAAVLDAMMADPALEAVFLVARYAGAYDDAAEERQFYSEFQKVASALSGAGKRVVVIYPWPEFPYSVPAHLARSALRGQDLARLGMSRAEFDRQSSHIVTMLDRMVDGTHILRADPARLLCRNTVCAEYANGRALYFDDDHLSVSGARYLAPVFLPFLGPPPVQPPGQRPVKPAPPSRVAPSGGQA